MKEKFKNYNRYLFSKFNEKVSLFTNLGFTIFVLTILQGITPFLFRVIIDLGINTKVVSFLNLLFVSYFVLMVSIGIGNIIKNYYSLLLSSKFKSSIIIDYLTLLLKKISSITFLSYGILYNKINDLNILNNFITVNLALFLNSVFITLLYLLLLLLFSKVVFFIFLFYLLLSFLWEFFFISYRKLVELELRNEKVREKNFWYELLNNIYDIKIYAKEAVYLERWKADNDELERLSFKSNLIKSKYELGSHLLSGGKNILILYVTVNQVLVGDISMGTLISIQFIIGFLNSPVSSFINFVSSYEMYKLSLNELSTDYAKFDTDDNEETKIMLSNQIYLLEMRGVKFYYPGTDVLVINNVSISLEKGKKYAIIGKSGSGKSSLLKIILGLYSPSYGIFKINSLVSTEVDIESYKKHFSAVIQESKLIKGTFADNIIYYNENIDFDWLYKVVELTNINDIISNYKRGVFDNIPNESNALSEGQKQRILLARAIYQNKDFIILDEATNSLDAYNEYVVLNNIKKLYAEKTMIVCTHNVNLIKDFDLIFFMSNGKIAEYGTHEELIQRKGHYNIMHSIQKTNKNE